MAQLEEMEGIPAGGLGVSSGAPGADGENRPRGGGEEGGAPGHERAPQSRVSLKRQASEMAKVRGGVTLLVIWCAVVCVAVL